MANINVVNTNLKDIEEIAISDSIFNVDIHEHVIYQIVTSQMAARRRGTAKTKTRGEVSASNVKPYRQKGTGRARLGTNRSPLLVGGGTIFGPIPRTFKKRLPKKVMRLGILSALSLKYKENNLTILDNLEVESAKTKDFVSIWQKLVNNKNVKTLFVIPKKNENLWLSSRNVGLVKITFPEKLNVYDLLHYDKLIILKSSLQKIEEVYGA